MCVYECEVWVDGKGFYLVATQSQITHQITPIMIKAEEIDFTYYSFILCTFSASCTPERQRKMVNGDVITQWAQHKTADESNFKVEQLLCCHYNVIKRNSYVTTQNSHHCYIGLVCVSICVLFKCKLTVEVSQLFGETQSKAFYLNVQK